MGYMEKVSFRVCTKALQVVDIVKTYDVKLYQRK